jgi:hypothetical protein
MYLQDSSFTTNLQHVQTIKDGDYNYNNDKFQADGIVDWSNINKTYRRL